MQSKPRVADYRGADAKPPREAPRPWLKKSAGEVAARVCGLGLCCLAASVPFMAIGGFFGFFAVLLMMIALLAWVVGSVVSIIGIFEVPEVRSHVGLGCAMALSVPFGFVILWVIGLIVLGRSSLGGH